MQFNPETKALYTDAGELVKVLHCPLRKQWDQLTLLSGSTHRNCADCERTILDTAAMTDAEVLAAVRKDPSSCLAVSAQQSNMTILHKGLPTPTLRRRSFSGTESDIED